eukprot:g2568.t1
MSEQYLYAFVHGFSKDQACIVGNGLKRRLKPHGIELDLIDARGGLSFTDCTISSGVDAVKALYETHKKPLRLIGDSMGGSIAANYTNQYPQNVDRLVLINPAFNLETNWQTIVDAFSLDILSELAMQKWKDEGQLILHAQHMAKPEPVSYNYVVDSLTYPAYPLVDISVLLFSSIHDTLIPAVTHQEWKKLQKDPEKVNIVELDEGHELRSEPSYEIVISTILTYFK